MSGRGHHDELRSEQTYVAGLYSRLDAERARAKRRYDVALRGDGGELVDRDVEVRALMDRKQWGDALTATVKRGDETLTLNGRVRRQ